MANKMATAKQIAFIESLIARTGGAGQRAAHDAALAINGQIEDLTTRQASALISDLLALANMEYTPAEPKPINLITESQIAYINDLVAQIGEEAEDVVSRYNLDSMERDEASEIIDTLIFLRRIRKAA